MKEDANLAISDGDRLSTGDELDGMCEYLSSQYVLDAFFSASGSKLFDPYSGIRGRVNCEVKELESWISDDSASRHMTSSHEFMTNYRECSGIVRTASGDVLPIEGVGDIFRRFPSDSGAFDIQLLNVAFVPQLSHNLLSLQQFTAARYTYFGTENGVELQFKSGRTVQVRKLGSTNVRRGYRMTRNDNKGFRATTAPGGKPTNSNMNVDINDFHCSLYPVHEGLLRETAKQRNVNLTGTLRECQGCSIAKGTREAHRYDNGNTSRRGGEGSKTAKLRSEEVETAGVKSNESGKDQVDVWSEGSDSKPVNVEVGGGDSEDDDEELYIFPQCAPAPAPAAAPKGRAAQLPSLTPAASSEGRAASPAPLTTADVSGGRVTPVTVVSVNEGYGSAEFEGSWVSSSPSVGHEDLDCVLNEDA